MNNVMPPPYTLIQISDTHLMDQADAYFVDINPERNFHLLMQHILHHHPHIDSIVHTGDVAQVAKPATYARYLRYMQNLKIPFYQTPGNHDDLTHFPYPNEQGPISLIEMGAWVMILLTSAVEGRIDGHIDDVQLEQLQQLLQQYSKRHILIGCHHHPLHMNSVWIDQHCLKNTPSLLDTLAKHPQVKAVIHGHVHQEFVEIARNITFLAVPATSVQFKPHSENFALDEIAPGYRVLYLYENGQIETKVYRVSHLIQKINNDISGY
ncbi:MAG: metallophosphoesterase [Acinetobacter sp.]